MATVKILVVEDEGIVAMDIENTLKNLGYSVPVVASSGERAVKKAVEVSPDLILMDIMLKGDMDGIQAAQKIREVLNVPIVYLTAYGDNSTLQRAKITEPFGYILKPFEERELYITIEMALYKHSLEKKIKCSEQHLQSVINSVDDAIISTDISRYVCFMNKKAEEITGYSCDDAKGKSLSEIFRPQSEEFLADLEAPLSRIISENASCVSMKSGVLLSAGNKEVSVLYKTRAIIDENDKVKGTVLVVCKK